MGRMLERGHAPNRSGRPLRLAALDGARTRKRNPEQTTELRGRARSVGTAIEVAKAVQPLNCHGQQGDEVVEQHAVFLW
jgi:hypothetical protein